VLRETTSRGLCGLVCRVCVLFVWGMKRDFFVTQQEFAQNKSQNGRDAARCRARRCSGANCRLGLRRGGLFAHPRPGGAALPPGRGPRRAKESKQVAPK
jgi:hypothetical protein